MNDGLRFPTGIEFFDKQTGGFYPGLIILLEEVGAGGKEFALSMIFKGAKKYFKSTYLSITLTRDEVIRDSKLRFPEAPKSRIEELEDYVKIISLAENYFKNTIIPQWWISDKKPTLKSFKKKEDDILVELVKVIDETESGNLIYIDSLSDLVRLTRNRISWNDLINFTKGLKKYCIKKDVLAITTLTKNMLDKGYQEELLDQADGVIQFEWEVHKDGVTRWMYIKKLLGILPLLERKRISKYNVKIDPSEGFTISQLVRIM